MPRSEFQIVSMIRARCAEEFGEHPSSPFFRADYRPGEYPDEALIRLFRAEQASSGASDEAVINALVYG